MPSASRGLAPREGLVLLVLQMGCTRPLMEPRFGPQAGKSGNPGSQNADSSPRVQGALGLGFEVKPKGKGEAPQAPIACGPSRRVALDGTWVSPLPHVASAIVRLDKTLLHARRSHHCVGSWRPAVGLPSAINEERGGAPLAHLHLLAIHSSFFLLVPSSCCKVHGTNGEALRYREGEDAIEELLRH